MQVLLSILFEPFLVDMSKRSAPDLDIVNPGNSDKDVEERGTGQPLKKRQRVSNAESTMKQALEIKTVPKQLSFMGSGESTSCRGARDYGLVIYFRAIDRFPGVWGGANSKERKKTEKPENDI